MFNPNVVVKISWRNQAQTVLLALLLVFLSLISFLLLVGENYGYAATAGYMEAMGVPGGLLPLVILVEFGGGLALLFGFQARFAAFGLGIFSILTAFLFHQGGADAAAQYNNGIHFMKNLAMAGGLFFLMLHGAGRISLDHAIEK